MGVDSVNLGRDTRPQAFPWHWLDDIQPPTFSYGGMRDSEPSERHSFLTHEGTCQPDIRCTRPPMRDFSFELRATTNDGQ